MAWWYSLCTCSAQLPANGYRWKDHWPHHLSDPPNHGCGLGLDVSVLRCISVSSSRQKFWTSRSCFGLGHLRLVPNANFWPVLYGQSNKTCTPVVRTGVSPRADHQQASDGRRWLSHKRGKNTSKSASRATKQLPWVIRCYYTTTEMPESQQS